MQWLYVFLPILWFYASIYYAGRRLTPSRSPPPRNGGMAMAIPMTTLEDGLQDEARKNDKYNPHWILVLL